MGIFGLANIQKTLMRPSSPPQGRCRPPPRTSHSLSLLVLLASFLYLLGGTHAVSGNPLHGYPRAGIHHSDAASTHASGTQPNTPSRTPDSALLPSPLSCAACQSPLRVPQDDQGRPVVSQYKRDHGNSIAGARVAVLIPAFGGHVESKMTNSLFRLERALRHQGVGMVPMFYMNESLVTRARNTLIQQAVDSANNYSHIFFLDADIAFEPEAVVRMLDKDAPMMCGIYPKKILNKVGHIYMGAGRGALPSLRKHFACHLSVILFSRSKPS